jgi:adenylate cyclase
MHSTPDEPLLELVEPTVAYSTEGPTSVSTAKTCCATIGEPTTPPSTTPGEEQATVLFVDLASFTPLTATMGEHAAAEVLRRFGITVRRPVISVGRH